MDSDHLGLSQSNIDAEFKLEMERMYMQREEKLSIDFNNQMHRAHFAQKDLFPPSMPDCVSLPNRPLRNIPVQPN